MFFARCIREGDHDVPGAAPNVTEVKSRVAYWHEKARINRLKPKINSLACYMYFLPPDKESAERFGPSYQFPDERCNISFYLPALS